MSKQPPLAPTAGAVGPCPTIIQKFTQHHRTTRPPPSAFGKILCIPLYTGVGRFRILGGQGLEYWAPRGGAKGGPNPSRHMTS